MIDLAEPKRVATEIMVMQVNLKTEQARRAGQGPPRYRPSLTGRPRPRAPSARAWR
jgi:hypothetical protein